MTLHDIFGTPYQFPVKIIKDGELVEEIVLLSPPTIKFYEVLLANYALNMEDAMSTDIDVQDAKDLVRLVSRTLQMLHIAASMNDPEVTLDTIEHWYKSDPSVMTNYLTSLKQFMPVTKEVQQKRKVVNPKVKTQPKKVWIPK
jgi:hypothetical protein